MYDHSVLKVFLCTQINTGSIQYEAVHLPILEYVFRVMFSLLFDNGIKKQLLEYFCGGEGAGRAPAPVPEDQSVQVRAVS